MTYFLERVAQLLKAEFDNTLNRHCLVFPNRRAGLYFLKYLAAEIDKPLWIPEILTINDLFRKYSTLQIADNEVLLFELYKIYRKVKKTSESFDDFYFWGDMLLNDFDDTDKYMVDASVMFRNVQDIKNIDLQFAGLTDEQIEIIKRFWTNFDRNRPTREKSEFTGIWSILHDLYSGFKKSLREQNLAYEGMIFRDLAERALYENNIEIEWDFMHFIGFNALNACEKTVMSFSKEAGKARFYWDYDNSYISGSRLNSAGFFLEQNLRIFGNDMPSDWSFNTLLSDRSGSAGRRVIDTSSDVAQVKLVSRLVEELPGLSSENAHHTAIVLADENLLVPVLTSLPGNISDINITMGYPLKHTQVYTLLKNLLLLQKNAKIEGGIVRFGHKDVLTILGHQYINRLMNKEESEIIKKIVDGNLTSIPDSLFAQSKLLRTIFRRMESPALMSEYLRNILSIISFFDKEQKGYIKDSQVQRNIMNEFIYRVLLTINRLEAITGDPDISFSVETYIRILDKILRGQSVPFSGEPLSGIQIMGILETRALDFKNLILLSVNEGILPRSSAGSSFIPYNLREAFGLPTINHQESIYAYHFYRLLQRAENVTFIYNSNSEGLRSGEMSRFLLQMKYEPSLCPAFMNQRFEISSHNTLEDTIERTEEHVKQLNSMFLDKKSDVPMSPTAINTWLNCRMRFFYRYVNRLKEPDKIAPDIDPATFGTLLHKIMKNLYSGLISQELTDSLLDSIIRNNNKLEEAIEEVINDRYKKGEDSSLSGNELIIKEILRAYLLKILITDRSLTPFTLLSLEKSVSFGINLNSGTSPGITEIRLGGDIDRIDNVTGRTRIVDYKTGKVSKKINTIGDLFSAERKKEFDGWLQTLLYCEAYLSLNTGEIVRPSIYKVKELTGENLSDYLLLRGGRNNDIIVDNYLNVRKEYLEDLSETVTKIFSINEPFIMTGDQRKCDYCPYKTLCMR